MFPWNSLGWKKGPCRAAVQLLVQNKFGFVFCLFVWNLFVTVDLLLCSLLKVIKNVLALTVAGSLSTFRCNLSCPVNSYISGTWEAWGQILTLNTTARTALTEDFSPFQLWISKIHAELFLWGFICCYSGFSFGGAGQKAIFSPETEDISRVAWSSFPFSVSNLLTEAKKASSLYSSDVRHCDGTSVEQFLFCTHVFAYNINILLSVIIWHRWYYFLTGNII